MCFYIHRGLHRRIPKNPRAGLVIFRSSIFQFRDSTFQFRFSRGGRKGLAQGHHCTFQAFLASIHRLASRVKRSSVKTLSGPDDLAASLSAARADTGFLVSAFPKELPGSQAQFIRRVSAPSSADVLTRFKASYQTRINATLREAVAGQIAKRSVKGRPCGKPLSSAAARTGNRGIMVWFWGWPSEYRWKPEGDRKAHVWFDVEIQTSWWFGGNICLPSGIPFRESSIFISTTIEGRRRPQCRFRWARYLHRWPGRSPKEA